MTKRDQGQAPMLAGMGLWGCQKCGALRGDPCRAPSGKTTMPHAGRKAVPEGMTRASEPAPVAAKTARQLDREISQVVASRPGDPPELWSDAELRAKLTKHLRSGPHALSTVRRFHAMMDEEIERRIAKGETGDRDKIWYGILAEYGTKE